MKKIMPKYLVGAGLPFLVIIFFVAQKGWAQDISFTAAAPKVLRAGEQFQLVYTINRNVDNFFPPEFGEFRFLGGPSTGSSTSISMVNGKTTRTSTFSYTYYLQAPSNAGKYTIGAATATYKKDNVSSNALEIEIVSSGQSGNVQSKSSNTQGQPGAASETAAGDDIFLCLVTDKNTAYVGEQITAWIKIYTKLRITGLDQRFKGPDFIGFYQQDVEIPPFSLEREKVGDDIYYAGVLKKVILYPQKSGKITIDPFEVLVEVQKQSKRRSQSIFDEFFGQQYDRSRINLRSKPVRFTIKQLPYPRPDDFGGAVGKFGIQASANESAVSTNDAITFKVVVSGRGNLKLIDDVNPDFPPAFDVFEPIKKVRIDNTSDGKSGKLSLEYTVIPRHAGDFKIPPFSLSYFNPAIAGYENIKTRDFDITVLKSDDDSTTVISGNLSKEDIELLGSDIRYITVKTNLKKGGHYIFGSKWFFALYVIVLILFILILILRKEQIKRTANIVRYKNRKAKKVAAKRLRKARALMKRNRKEEFYEEIGRALWNYLSDKLSIQVSDLSKEKAKEKLVSLTIEEQLINEFFDLVDTCEFARFAPGKADTDLQNLYNSASKTISRLDQKL